jgi:hypothetical protein
MLTGAIGVNDGRDVRAAMKLIERCHPVEAAELADSAVDLRKLRR